MEVNEGRRKGNVAGRADAGSSSSSTGRRRALAAEKENISSTEGVDGDDEGAGHKRVFVLSKAEILGPSNKKLVKLDDRKNRNWELLGKEAQALCVKAIVRVLVIKGARKESVKRDAISDCLDKIDNTYRRCVDAALNEAKLILEDTFGYTLVHGGQIRGVAPRGDGKGDTKSDEYFVVNAVRSPKLMEILTECDDDTNSALKGFAFAVFHAIFTSPGRELDGKSLLKFIRKLEPRFEETMIARKSSNAAKKACSVPELGDDFIGLLGKLKKRGYLLSEKDAQEGDDPGKTVYSLGPRFFAEVGKTRLMKSYFVGLDQVVDVAVLREIDLEDPVEDEDEEGEGGGGNEQGNRQGGQPQEGRAPRAAAPAQAQIQAQAQAQVQAAGNQRRRGAAQAAADSEDEVDEDEDEEEEMEDKKPKARGRGAAKSRGNRN